MKDSIMILGGANLHCKLVEAAHQMGKETVVVDNIKNSPAKLISDYSYDIDVREVDRLGICHMQRRECGDIGLSGFLPAILPKDM